MRVKLSEWLEASKARAHKTSRHEIDSLLKAADRDLADAQLPGLSADRKFTTAYSAALLTSTAALAASGYRAPQDGHHYWTIRSLGFTLEPGPRVIDQFDAFRRKRNIADYETAGMVSEAEIKNMLSLAKSLRLTIVEWLKKNHRELIGE
jgi:hypothetical protein